jgi:hypothetical protein
MIPGECDIEKIKWWHILLMFGVSFMIIWYWENRPLSIPSVPEPTIRTLCIGHTGVYFIPDDTPGAVFGTRDSARVCIDIPVED